jgi:hypothetical protein
VIVVTADAHAIVPEEVTRLGARLLHKPVSATRLLVEMLQALSR